MFTFKVEDGTGYEDSTSYVSVEYADEYITFWYDDEEWNTLTIEDKEKKLMIATSFLDSSVRWQSSIRNIEQALQFPRQDFFDLDGRIVRSNIVPQAVKDAVVQLAYSSLSNTLSTKGYSIKQESFGDSSDTYAAPVTVYENEAVRSILLALAALGYAQSRTTYVTFQRQ